MWGDNAAAESFLGTLKTELVNRQNYRSRHQVRLSIRTTATERMGGQLLPSHSRINQVSSPWGELQGAKVDTEVILCGDRRIRMGTVTEGDITIDELCRRYCVRRLELFGSARHRRLPDRH